jgi:hypothetical protein
MNAIIRNRFPVIVVVAASAVMVAGFARTYYLKFLFDAPPLSVAAQLHGLLATMWLALHYTQARLIASHRADIHRRLGILAACVGFLLAAHALHLGISRVAAGHAPPGRDPLQFLSVSVGTTTLFASFLIAALVMRRRREWHSRLMLLATLALLVPAAGRFDSFLMQPLGLPRGQIALPLTAVFIAWGCIHDWRKRGRMHPAYVIGGAALLVSIPLRAWVGFTDAWLPVAKWLVGSVA